MNTLEQAINLNNKAALILQSGRVVDAAHLLQRVLVTVKNAEFGPVVGEQEPVPIPTTVAAEWASNSSGNGDGASEKWHNQDGLIYIYDRHLFLPSKVHVDSLEQYNHILHTVSMHAIFNLALAYHLQGRITGAETPSARAIDLYYMVLSSFEFDANIEVVANNSKRMGRALWQCLVLNNLAHLHYEFCEYERSQYCMERVADILRRTNCLAKSSNILSDNDMSSFALNCLILNHFPTAAKAA